MSHSKQAPNVTFISLEGSIGAGKSTVVKAIAELGRDDVIVLQEPVDRWTAKNIESPIDGTQTSLLEAYYHDAKSVAMAFQMYAMLTRVQQLSDIVEQLSNNPKPMLIVAERCSWSDYELFGKPMRDKGLLSDADWYVYTAWFKAVTESRLAPPIRPSGYVFLNCSPQGCMDRIAMRARPGEEEIDLPYMEALHGAHVKFFETQKMAGVPVMEFDGSAEGPDVVKEAAERIVEWGILLGKKF